MLDLRSTEMAMVGAAVAFRTRRDVVVVVGDDAATYLHGQLSQDVTGLGVGDSVATLLLQPQGKVAAWGRLSRIEDEQFWFDVDAGHGEQVVARLERFKIRVDVAIELRRCDVVAVRGPNASDGPVGLGIEVPEGAAVLQPVWPGVTGFDLVADTAPGESPIIPDSLPEGSADGLEVERIALGMPAMGSELDESTIPAAAGLVDGSVDFTKGCYVGQELVARIDSRGADTPTRLRGMRIASGADVPAGAAVVADGATVGTVTSVVDSAGLGTIGLVYVKRGTAVPSAATVADGSGATVPVELLDLPLSATPTVVSG